mmetsp:Transcript_21984/g.35628  ORF Transcript_21984/g.35628 Transcript_21984/m.35628 type:complete len:204 (+) Transcript_21984:170-781(+)
MLGRLRGVGGLLSSGCTAARRALVGTTHAAHGLALPVTRSTGAADHSTERPGTSWQRRCGAAPVLTRTYWSESEISRDPRKGDKSIFGVVQIGANQFKVSPDDLIFVEKFAGYQVNDMVVLPEVLLLSNMDRTIVGRPSVPNAAVHAVVEEHFRDSKKLIFKKKRRKGYQRLKGHRQELTALRILSISGVEGLTTPSLGVGGV